MADTKFRIMPIEWLSMRLKFFQEFQLMNPMHKSLINMCVSVRVCVRVCVCVCVCALMLHSNTIA